ncbi:helix-turn-helix domain-containing protein [Mesorhizobium sp. B1-1-8]|uniref:helix-turn-helix domain-containing protein n=1 Tax=Mesorhizobium sp. B1-1-8 TaxID=2589976 RepID=UPI0015E3FF6F|nr:AraC family transcriptional regulator [Mesorhizobium sp. B1-1-8]UCI05177.1 AraC family transcriptional regulator [Mesorhizobium sp. B1-1-8]
MAKPYPVFESDRPRTDARFPNAPIDRYLTKPTSLPILSFLAEGISFFHFGCAASDSLISLRRFGSGYGVSHMSHPIDVLHDSPNRSGAFGENLASHFHLQESDQVSVEWPGGNPFAVTRLQSSTGTPDRTTRVPSEAALLISVAILPVPLRAYELWIDGKAIDVPFIPSLRTIVMDLQSDPVAWVGAGFDYVHYHVPREGLDEIARDHGIEPLGSYKFAMCEHDIVLAQLTRHVLPFVESQDWNLSLALDQFSLVLGAHVLRTYGGLPPLRVRKGGGLAPWQARRAAELIAARLNGNLHLSELARECGLSVSHFTRAFRKSFNRSPYRWLLERRIDHAKALMMMSASPIVDVAIQSGFSDQASFTRAFVRVVGDSPARWRRAVTSRG